MTIFLTLCLNACTKEPVTVKETQPMTIDTIAQDYVKLTLLIGQHHSSYIDAYYGPKEWRPSGEPLALHELTSQAKVLREQLKKLSLNIEPSSKQRVEFLQMQLDAAGFFISHLLDKKQKNSSFDKEAKGLYDATSPEVDLSKLDLVLNQLDDLLPGTGSLNMRLEKFNSGFVIPTEKLDIVFSAAIDEARARTKKYIPLPANENFTIEYVTDKVWSGYNWYKGNNYSLIQINTDFPIYIDRAIDLASHEGYPGHHVFNSQMEQHLVNNNGWIEYSVYPLFSPMSLLAEGSANYGIEVAFPHKERMTFEREVLFELAGLDASKVERYYRVQAIVQQLSYAGNYVAKHYLDGDINKEQAIELLMKYSLSTREKSMQRIGFIEANRAYVINYNLGQDIVKAYIHARAGGDEAKRWQVFANLLALPKTASMMQKQTD